jgi:hypothetical protein
MTAHYRNLSAAAIAVDAENCARASVCRLGFVQVGFCPVIRACAAATVAPKIQSAVPPNAREFAFEEMLADHRD